MTARSSQGIYADTLAVFDRREHRCEPLTTPEVADALGANRRTVYKRLKKLVDRGELDTKETGANSRVWWRPAAGSSAPRTTGSETGAKRERESDRSRETLRILFDEAPDGIVVHDVDGRILDVNETFVEMVGYTRKSLLSMDVADFEVGVDETTLRESWRSLEPGLMRRIAVDGTHRRKDGSTYPVEVWVSRVTTDDGGRDQFVALGRDITERTERERELREKRRQLQGILDTVEATIFVKDTDGRYLQMNQNCRDMLGVEDDTDVVGMTDGDLFPDDVAAQYRADDARVLEAKETIEIEEKVPTTDGIRTYLTRKTPIFDEEGDPYAVCAVSTDITERKLEEKRSHLRQAQTVADLGSWQLDLERDELYWSEEVYNIFGISGDESLSYEQFVEHVHPEDREYVDEKWSAALDGADYDIEHRIVTENGETRWVQERADVEFGRDGTPTTAFGIVQDITERKERERELQRQREQLEALNRINDVVRGITEAVIDQSTREEIEQVVCDRLADSDSYQFAWICAVNSDMEIERREIAGSDGQFDDVPLSCDPDDQIGRGPTDKSVRTREIQIGQNLPEDADIEPCHEDAREGDYRSSASIPIVHEDTLYGVIGLASERADAFAEGEREVVARLGEVVGHAIAAVERKRALLSDEVVELGFRMHDVEELGLSSSSGGRVVFDRILPLGDGTYLEYGTATGDEMETVRALVDAELTPHSGPVNVIESSGDETRFELRLIDPPFIPAIVDSGGYIDEARIEDGIYSVRVHLPPGADVHHTVDAVTETFPATKMVSRRQTTRSAPTAQQIMQTLAERLTDRQRAALEAGYFGGFFEWPRDRSGEEVADSLGIAASTFHQHVRKAEKKLLDVVFTET